MMGDYVRVMIERVVDAGKIPITVKDFPDVHRYCAANELGDAHEVWASLGSGDEADAFVNEAQGIVDQWIKNGGLR